MVLSKKHIEMIEQISRDIDELKKTIPKNDIVPNEEYCKRRTARGAKLTMRGLREWFAKDVEPKCPRVDSRHVSESDVDRWAENYFTNKNLNE